MEFTVGQVAELAKISVRTLHHYDEIGLLRPSARSRVGYRLYGDHDLDRLQQIMLYRGLGFSLEDVAAVLDDPTVSTTAHLRRQLRLIAERMDQLTGLRAAVLRQLEAYSMNIKLTREEQFEIFGEDFARFGADYAREAEARWGDSQAWRQSQDRTAEYTAQQWQQIKAEDDDLNHRLAAAMQSGEPAERPAAMDLAEQGRQQITRWFYDCSVEIHRGLGQMYAGDERFRAHYEAVAPGLADYLSRAVAANADRQEADGR